MGTTHNIMAAVLASTGVAISSGDWSGFAEKFGVTAALLLYFVIRDINNQKRSDRERDAMVRKINALEKDYRDALSNALQANTDAMRYCQSRWHDHG